MDTQEKLQNIRLEGDFEACGHTITFHYDLRGVPNSDDQEVIDRLTVEAEERARTMIADECVAGELNALIPVDGPDGHMEVGGWWQIAS